MTSVNSDSIPGFGWGFLIPGTRAGLVTSSSDVVTTLRDLLPAHSHWDFEVRSRQDSVGRREGWEVNCQGAVGLA